MMEVVGLYLNSPENALVLSVDEKISIKGLGRKHFPELMRPGEPERVDHEYVRHQISFSSILGPQGRGYGTML